MSDSDWLQLTAIVSWIGLWSPRGAFAVLGMGALLLLFYRL